MCYTQVIHHGTMLIIWATFGQLPARTMPAEAPQKAVVGQAEVTANDLYIRSGPSLNHYTIAKLNAGDRVTVVGESGDWLEILPPAGVFSLISGDYVDSADGQKGVVNGDNVRVRSGSLLNKNKYTVQLQLSKGTEVEIVGREADGFLRIRPPKGATVWVNRQYVEYVPNERLRLKSAASPPVASTRKPEGAGAEPPTAAGGQPTTASTALAAGEKPDTKPGDGQRGGDKETRPTALAGLEPTAERGEVEKLDAEVRSELSKPAIERRLEPFIERYQQIAEQAKDDFTQRYARARVAQLTNMNELLLTVRNLRSLVDDTEERRREFLEDRARIRTAVVPVRSGLDAQGELRTSAVHPPGSWPRRYRLVNTSGPSEHTVGYVEIPRGSAIEVSDFLGRYVGVRASAKHWQTGGVDPVPIFVARELVLLRPTSTPPSEPD